MAPVAPVMATMSRWGWATLELYRSKKKEGHCSRSALLIVNPAPPAHGTGRVYRLTTHHGNGKSRARRNWRKHAENAKRKFRFGVGDYKTGRSYGVRRAGPKDPPA